MFFDEQRHAAPLIVGGVAVFGSQSELSAAVAAPAYATYVDDQRPQLLLAPGLKCLDDASRNAASFRHLVPMSPGPVTDGCRLQGVASD